MFRRFAKRRNCSTLRGRHSADLPLKPSLAYKGTRRSSFAAPRLEWRPLADCAKYVVLPQPSKFKLEGLAVRDDVRVRNPHLSFFANSTVKHWG